MKKTIRNVQPQVTGKWFAIKVALIFLVVIQLLKQVRSMLLTAPDALFGMGSELPQNRFIWVS